MSSVHRDNPSSREMTAGIVVLLKVTFSNTRCLQRNVSGCQTIGSPTILPGEHVCSFKQVGAMPCSIVVYHLGSPLGAQVSKMREAEKYCWATDLSQNANWSFTAFQVCIGA